MRRDPWTLYNVKLEAIPKAETCPEPFRNTPKPLWAETPVFGWGIPF